jgi:hypothetical protein
MIITASTNSFPPRASYAANPHVEPMIVPIALNAKIQIVEPTAFSNTRTKINGAQTASSDFENV